MFKVSGEGCRATPAWATEATREEIQRKRQEFWETRVQGSTERWLALRAACEAADSRTFQLDTAESIVKASGLSLQQASITLCMDEFGMKYELPPFMINEPLFYGQIKQIQAAPPGPNRAFTVTVRSSKRPDVQLTVSTHDTGETLKTAYISHTKATEAMRLFFNGVEIKQGSYLARLEDGVVVQALG